MTDTRFLSRYLMEIILAKLCPLIVPVLFCMCRLFSYLELCSDALRLLYEELMLPLPVQLSSPGLDTSYATSDGESPFCSVSKPLVATSTVEDNARFLIICMASLHCYWLCVTVVNLKGSRVSMASLRLRSK